MVTGILFEEMKIYLLMYKKNPRIIYTALCAMHCAYQMICFEFLSIYLLSHWVWILVGKKKNYLYFPENKYKHVYIHTICNFFCKSPQVRQTLLICPEHQLLNEIWRFYKFHLALRKCLYVSFCKLLVHLKLIILSIKKNYFYHHNHICKI